MTFSTITAPNPENEIMSSIRLLLPFLNQKHGPWAAGGSVRRAYAGSGDLSISDIDVFFPSKVMADWTVSFFESFRNGGVNGFQVLSMEEFPMSKVFQIMLPSGKVLPLQVCYKEFHPTVEKLLESFDFTMCMFATDGELFTYDDRAPVDLAAKSLVVTRKPSRPKPMRLAKYLAQGFKPAPGTLSAMLGANLSSYFEPQNGLVYDEY